MLLSPSQKAGKIGIAFQEQLREEMEAPEPSTAKPPKSGAKREYLIGKAGGDYIRNSLSTKQPRQVFDEIQHTYGLLLPDDKYFLARST